jgi:hypothetical protein
MIGYSSKRTIIFRETELEPRMLNVTVKGVGDFRKKLDDLARRTRELHGQHEVPLSELMSTEFISGCSSYSSLQELFRASQFEIKSTDDFKAIPDAEWDAFINANTSYATWEEMQKAAVREWTRRKLDLRQTN